MGPIVCVRIYYSVYFYLQSFKYDLLYIRIRFIEKFHDDR